MPRQVDIAVVGGGLVGKASAVVAAQAGFDVLHIAPATPPDRRTSALMMPSVNFMKSAGLISGPENLGVPLTKIRIIDATDRLLRAPETLFEAREAGLDAFGWNFANERLSQAFQDAAAPLANLASHEATLTAADHSEEGWELTLSDGETIACKLLVGADGKGSSVRNAAGLASRETRHAQSALVCDLLLARPLEGCSVEFHYPEGPFTLVPAGENRANLVWIDRPEVLESARTDGTTLIQTLAERSQHLFGDIEIASPSFLFPLSSLVVDKAGAKGAVLVGESAHAFPPIGAQGLNLGLRDVQSFAACLDVANRGSWGWAEALSRSYANARAGDLARTGAFVDSLFSSLISDMLPAQALRSSGLWALRAFPALRKRAIRFGLG